MDLCSIYLFVCNIYLGGLHPSTSISNTPRPTCYEWSWTTYKFKSTTWTNAPTRQSPRRKPRPCCSPVSRRNNAWSSNHRRIFVHIPFINRRQLRREPSSVLTEIKLPVLIRRSPRIHNSAQPRPTKSRNARRHITRQKGDLDNPPRFSQVV
jgi:hypothetical protein